MRDVRLAFRNLLRRRLFRSSPCSRSRSASAPTPRSSPLSSAVLLAPLPYDRPDDVVILNEQTPQFPTVSVTRYNYDDWRTRAQVVRRHGGVPADEHDRHRHRRPRTRAGEDDHRVAAAAARCRDRARARFRRGATTAPGAEGVAILSAGFARAGSPGQEPARTVAAARQPSRTPSSASCRRDFELFQPADVYVPFGPWAATLPEDRGWHPGIFPIARLKEGVTLEQARVEMDAISRAARGGVSRFEQEHPRAGHAGPGSAGAEHPPGAACC